MMFAIALAIMAAATGAPQPATAHTWQVSDAMILTISQLDVSSLAFEDGGRIPAIYTADGQDMSPPKGKPHRYVFTVYALDAKPDLPAGISK